MSEAATHLIELRTYSFYLFNDEVDIFSELLLSHGKWNRQFWAARETDEMNRIAASSYYL